MVTTTTGIHSCGALGGSQAFTKSSSTSLIPQPGNFDETTVQENDADNLGANTGAVRQARNFSKSSSRRNETCMVVMNKMDMAARTDVERRGEDECDGMYGEGKSAISHVTRVLSTTAVCCAKFIKDGMDACKTDSASAWDCSGRCPHTVTTYHGPTSMPLCPCHPTTLEHS